MRLAGWKPTPRHFFVEQVSNLLNHRFLVEQVSNLLNRIKSSDRTLSLGVVGLTKARVTRDEFLQDRQGKTFADVLNDSDQPFDKVLEFFSDPNRQRRMEESELHHDRSPLAGVVRELEADPEIDRFLADAHIRRNTRFRQAIGVLVRLIMERRGWQKTGRKGSLGVRAAGAARTPAHNTGGLAFWFVRAERYERADGMPFRSVRERCEKLESSRPRASGKAKRSRRTEKR